jgi:hypothetical protein
VWRKFHFFCGTAVSSICVTETTAFSCYGFRYIYKHAWCVSCTRERHNPALVCGSVIVVLISLWKLKFLAYMLNVTQHDMTGIAVCLGIECGEWDGHSCTGGIECREHDRDSCVTGN